MPRFETWNDHQGRLERLVLGLLFASVLGLVGHAVLGIVEALRRSAETRLAGSVQQSTGQEPLSANSVWLDERIQSQSKVGR